MEQRRRDPKNRHDDNPIEYVGSNDSLGKMFDAGADCSTGGDHHVMVSTLYGVQLSHAAQGGVGIGK